MKKEIIKKFLAKNVLIVFSILFSINVFSLSLSNKNIYVSKNIFNISDLSNIGIWVSYPLEKNINLPAFGVNYNDKNEFFTYQRVFLKNIRLKSGERNFGVNLGYDFEKNSIVLSTEIKKYKNDLISKSFSYSYTAVFKGGSEKRNIGIDRFLIPTIAKASIFSTSYNNIVIDNNISNYAIQLQRYFMLPFVLSTSELGYSLSVPVGIFDDKYISGFFSYGILYDGEYSPLFNFQTPFKFKKNDYYIGMQLKMSNKGKFIAYLSKIDINNPFTIIITNNGGSFFFEY
ncbi:hypothetical protein JCM30566_19060 [Marinitoga arctica]